MDCTQSIQPRHEDRPYRQVTERPTFTKSAGGTLRLHVPKVDATADYSAISTLPEMEDDRIPFPVRKSYVQDARVEGEPDDFVEQVQAVLEQQEKKNKEYVICNVNGSREPPVSTPSKKTVAEALFGKLPDDVHDTDSETETETEDSSWIAAIRNCSNKRQQKETFWNLVYGRSVDHPPPSPADSFVSSANRACPQKSCFAQKQKKPCSVSPASERSPDYTELSSTQLQQHQDLSSSSHHLPCVNFCASSAVDVDQDCPVDCSLTPWTEDAARRRFPPAPKHLTPMQEYTLREQRFHNALRKEWDEAQMAEHELHSYDGSHTDGHADDDSIDWTGLDCRRRMRRECRASPSSFCGHDGQDWGSFRLNDSSTGSFRLEGLNDSSTGSFRLGGLNDSSTGSFRLSGLNDSNTGSFRLTGMNESNTGSFRLSGLQDSYNSLEKSGPLRFNDSSSQGSFRLNRSGSLRMNGLQDSGSGIMRPQDGQDALNRESFRLERAGNCAQSHDTSHDSNSGFVSLDKSERSERFNLTDSFRMDSSDSLGMSSYSSLNTIAEEDSTAMRLELSGLSLNFESNST